MVKRTKVTNGTFGYGSDKLKHFYPFLELLNLQVCSHKHFYCMNILKMFLMLSFETLKLSFYMNKYFNLKLSKTNLFLSFPYAS